MASYFFAHNSEQTTIHTDIRRVSLFLIFAILCAGNVCAVSTGNIVDQLSLSEYQTYHTDIENCGLGWYDPALNQGFRNRDGWSGEGSLGNQEARQYIHDTFSTLGLTSTIQGDYRNVIGELPGQQNPERIVIVCAHYDTYGDGERPGGDDNASGTAAILELARVFSQYDFASTIRFAAFNAEEDWMKGSSDYVDNVVVPNNEYIVGVVNLDMILRPAWDSDPTQPIDIDITTRDFPEALAWANTFIETAAVYAPQLLIDADAPNSDRWDAGDQGPFLSEDIPAIMVMENKVGELWNEDCNFYYHTADDATNGLANDPLSPTGIAYDYDFAMDVVRTTAAMLANEAEIIPEPATMLFLLAGSVYLLRRKKL